MKLTCSVIKDLLPLYVENIASSDSCNIIKEHIATCEGCKKEVESLKTPSSIQMNMDTAPLEKMKSSLRKRRYLTILFSVMITVSVLTILLGYVKAPEYLSYTENRVSIIEANEELVIAKFDDQVSGYDINRYIADDHSGYVYHITAWDSLWNRSILNNTSPNVVLNPSGEKVVAVYYYLTDGSKDILIYGKDEDVGRGVVTLPRLFLTHYAIFAMILIVFLGMFLIICRRKEVIKNKITKILLLPISYLLGHIFIKGFKAASYSATHDFFSILLTMIPIYCTLIVTLKLLRYRKQNIHKRMKCK